MKQDVADTFAPGLRARPKRAARGAKRPAERASPRAFAQVRDGATPPALLDLGGAWEFRAVGDGEWLAGEVPGTVHTDLLRAGRIEDPFYRDNELKVQWVEQREWEYRRAFHVSPELLAHDRVLLECRGLDTIAEVRLNGQLVARTINMWIEHEFDVKAWLRPGENTVHIVLRSPFRWAEEQRATDAKAAAICPPDDPRLDSTKGLTFWLRKEACSFGWDWSPRLATCGIWKPVRLVGCRAGRIADFRVQADLREARRARLALELEIESCGGGDLSLEIEVTLRGQRVARERCGRVSPGPVRLATTIARPRLWWPNGWGEQPLYEVIARLRDRAGVAHERRLRIGLRTIELVRTPDARGETFGFRVNGRPLFAKGSNWAPADAFAPRLAESHYRALLGAAREANYNMLRIWGGGRYEADIFYELCDELGIMVWQDFMFAAGPYVANEAYLANVRAEIASVVRRRRHHACLALWCGNNESETNMVGAQAWLQRYPAASWADYDRIFHGAIPAVVAQHDPGRPYWPSSPHHPLDRETPGEEREARSGDAHDWTVWHDARPFTQFERMAQYRFVSEWGFCSLPPRATIDAFTAPDDRRFNSYILDHHEKTGVMKRAFLANREPNRGTARIARFAASYFPMPGGLDEWIYVSQLLQAEALRTATEVMRRNFPASAGALHWQFNENWPVIGYSSVDYFGRWKAAQYHARHYFAPVLVSAAVRETRVALWGVNDSLAPVGARLEWALARFDGAEVQRGSAAVTLAPTASEQLVEIDLAEHLAEEPAHATYRNDSFANASRHYLWFRLRRGGRTLAENTAFFAPHKYLQLADPGLHAAVHTAAGRTRVRVSAQRFAAFVEIGVRGGYARFSDNFFHLRPGETREVDVIEATRRVTPRTVTLRSLGRGAA